jgi:hypothetical protein
MTGTPVYLIKRLISFFIKGNGLEFVRLGGMWMEKLEWSCCYKKPSPIFLNIRKHKPIFTRVFSVFNQTFDWDKTGFIKANYCLRQPNFRPIQTRSVKKNADCGFQSACRWLLQL